MLFIGRSCNACVHRIDRVLSFFSSRRNWDSPTPSPLQTAVYPPTPRFRLVAHSLAGEGVGESQFRRGDIHCGTLYTKYSICTLCLRHITLYNIPKQCTRLKNSSAFLWVCQNFLEHKHDGVVVKQDKCKHRYVLQPCRIHRRVAASSLSYSFFSLPSLFFLNSCGFFSFTVNLSWSLPLSSLILQSPYLSRCTCSFV